MIKDGKYFSVAVDSDHDFVLDVAPGVTMDGFSAQRSTASQGEALSEVDAAKKALKDGIDEVKKGGWKAAFGMAKKLVDDLGMDEREKRAQKEKESYKDPMDPKNAFALDDDVKIRYEAVMLLENKDNTLDYFQYRTDNSYGVLQEISEGLFREISFSFPSHEYAEKHNPLEIIQGASNANWRREDDNLHKMRVHYLSQDQSKAESAAKASSLETVRKEWFTIDYTSSRDQEKVRFSEPRFNLNGKNGEVALYSVAAWFLPRLTQSGRQIQYNWDALRISITQGDRLIKRFISWSAEKGHDVIKSQRTNMALSDGGYIGALEEGEYQLRISIYEDEVFCYPFEMIKTTSTDKQNPLNHYYNIRTPRDDYANVILNNESWDLDIYYPAVRLLEKCGSLEKFDLSIRATQNGKDWQGYEWNEYEKGGLVYDQVVRDKADWADQRLKLSLPCGSHSTFHKREQAAKGVFDLHIEVDGETIDLIKVNLKDDAQVEAQAVAIDQPLADIDFPEEHEGLLIPLINNKK